MESHRIHACYVPRLSHTLLKSTFWSKASKRYVKLIPHCEVDPVITCHDGTEGCIALLLTSVLDGGVSGRHHRSAALSPGKRPGTHCSEGWVGPKAGLDIEVTR